MKENSEKTEKKQKRRGAPPEYLFKPGQSGNPKGRPRGSKNFDTLFKKAIRKIAKEKKLPVKDPEVEMVVRAVIEALEGNYSFFKDLMDRRYGTPKGSVDINFDDNIKKVKWEIIKDERDITEDNNCSREKLAGISERNENNSQSGGAGEQ